MDQQCFSVRIYGETIYGKSFFELVRTLNALCLLTYTNIFKYNFADLDEFNDYFHREIHFLRFGSEHKEESISEENKNEIVFNEEQEKIFQIAVERLRKEMSAVWK